MTPVALGIVLVAIAGLIFVSALFSGLETALFSLRPHQLRRLEQNHPALVNFVQLFRDKPRRVLNVLLLGDGLVKVPLVVLCLFLLWRGPLAGHLPQWVAAILIFAIVVLLCDLVPKLIELRRLGVALRITEVCRLEVVSVLDYLVERVALTRPHNFVRGCS